MARLIIQTQDIVRKAFELRLGVNRVGRDTECEVHLPHATVSSHHAELALTGDGIHLLDCDSTNGTFINGTPVEDAWLTNGQLIRFGDVEVLIESVDAMVAIPQFDRIAPQRPAPVLLEGGRTACPEHPDIPATFRCPHCKEHMCNACIKVIRLKGRAPHYLCRLCSHPAERIEAVAPKKKKGFFALLQKTAVMKFIHPRKEPPAE